MEQLSAAERALAEHYRTQRAKATQFQDRLAKLGSFRYAHVDGESKSLADVFQFEIGTEYDGRVHTTMTLDDFERFLQWLEDKKRSADAGTAALWNDHPSQRRH